MNHLEDIVEVTLETQMDSEVGHIATIMCDGFYLDTSKRYRNSSVFCQYKEVLKMKSVSE